MTNILLLYESLIPTVEMSGATLMEFSNRYKNHFAKMNILDVKISDIKNADILVCVRGESPLMSGILQCGKKNKKKIIFLLDDDLGHMPKGAFRYPGRKKWLYRCLADSHILLTGNQLIGEDYACRVGDKRYVIIDSDISEGEINEIIREDNKITKIVYAASEKHVYFFEKYIHPIMGKLYKKYGNGIAFYFIGLHPKLEQEEYGSIIHYVPGMPYQEYTEYMRKNRFDIGLAPLEVNHFTARKYFNKFLEYTKDGICGIYSDCMPYQLVVRNGENGYMVKNSCEEWLKTIERVIENKEERIRAIENAQQYIREAHSKNVIYGKLAEDIPELLNYNSGEEKEELKIRGKLCHKLFRLKESTYLTAFSLRNNGWKETKMRIYRKLGGTR